MPRQPVFKKRSLKSPEYTRPAGAGLFLFIWFLLARLVGNPLLLPGPWAVAQSLVGLLGRTDFWHSLGLSLLGILGGFAAALLFALAAGVLAFCFPAADMLFSPLLSICRSAPLAALTIILMIWLKASALPFVLILLAISPPLYADCKAGLAGASPKLLEMAFVFRFRRRDTVRYIYLPALRRQLAPTLEFTAGLAWKAGITGEILALPAGHLGTRLYEAKIQLESAEVLALLAAIVCLSWLLAALLLRLLRRERPERSDLLERSGPGEDEADAAKAAACAPAAVEKRPAKHPAAERTRCKPADSRAVKPAIVLRHLQKSFGDKEVLTNLSAEIPAGQITCVAGPSGQGKSTLFRILLGLEEADGGEIIYANDLFAGGTVRYAAAFQDGRLLEQCSGLENLLLVSGLRTAAEKEGFGRKWAAEMRALGLPPEQAVRFYSGGMKQKLSLLRTLASPSDILILDEVFREVDEVSEEAMRGLLLREKGERTVLMASHKAELSEELADFVIFISNL